MKENGMEDMKALAVRRDVVISSCGCYRYWLLREWDESLPRVTWIMLSPSTADADVDDPTIRRCMDFGKRWGAGSIVVVNLFALRSTDPGALRKATDPIGRGNDEQIVWSTKDRRVIAAWGCHGTLHGRDREVMRLLGRAGRNVECLGTTKDGHPRHPLYVAADAVPRPFVPDSAS